MNIGRLSGGLPYTFGQGWKNALETSGCKTVYNANPSAIIRKNPDKIVAKSHYTEDEALWNQYMKPYREALKIVDDQLVVNADIRHLTYLRKQFRQKNWNLFSENWSRKALEMKLTGGE